MYGLLGATMAGFFGGPWWTWALGAWATVAILGVLHVRLSAALLKLLLAAEVAVVVAFDVAALTHPADGQLDFIPLSPMQLTGAGVGGVVALTVACFLGVETAPAFAEEARSHRVLAVASFAGLVVLGVLFAGSAWAMAAATGTGQLTDVTTEVFFGTLEQRLGLLVLILAELLLVTSMLAAMISVHQTVARYVFVLARERLLPRGSGRVRRGRGVPVGGSLVQSAIGLILIALWTVVRADPMVLFAWLAALAAVGTMTLMIVACWAALGFFRHGGGGNESAWTRIVAPLAGMVAMGAMLAVTVTNLHSLVGVDRGSPVVWLLPSLVAGTGAAGLVWGLLARRRRPGLLLGYGEPEPLAELPHHLVDVQI
jgi:amino acid transporter